MHQLDQVILPHGGARVRAVAARFVARGNQDVAAARDLRNLAFENAELRRIHFVIGGVDCEQRGADFPEVRLRVVVRRASYW